MPTPPPPDPPPSPESLFADYLSRRAAGSAPELEAFCGAHPEHARAVRELLGQYDRVQAALRAAGAGEPGFDPASASARGSDAARSGPDGRSAAGARAAPSFATRLKQRYGAGVDPEISLDAAPGALSPASEGSSASPGSASGSGSAASTGAPAGSTATDALVRRLREHSLEASRYQLEGELARGGMGAILKIWDEDLRRHLAMKIILGRGDAPGAGGTPAVEARQLARFLEEAQVTGQLDHPGIVPVHELGLDGEGRVYFTMKLVKGRELKAVFELVFAEAEGWNETRALSVILRACEAMAYAHKKGVIHRDLKPGNIMVGNFGEVYVMDWGLARVLGKKDSHDIRIAPEFTTGLTSVKTERREEREEHSDSPVVTMDGDVVGTPAYMPPEQARGEIEKLGPRSDVYAIGAMLYHLLTRQVPYVPRGTRLSNRTVLGLVVNGPPAALSALRKDVPAELVAIVEKAMARESARRYADTLALAEDLRAFLEHRVVGAYETGAWAETRKWVERNRPLAASLAAAILLLVAGLTASLWFKARADERAADLLSANTTIQSKSTDLEAKNVALDAATKTAQENALAAQAQETIAREQEQLATQKTKDVLSLSAMQDLQDLADGADRLWPAHPEHLAAYAAWLEQARDLVEGRAEDQARGIKAKPSLAEHESKLRELEARALPQSDEERAAERASHPKAAELAARRSKSQWMARLLGHEPWPSAAEAETELARGPALPTDANGLNKLAWPLVDPNPAKEMFGDEVQALVLARRAVAAAKEGERHMSRDTLAWALYRNGRFDEALAEEQTALSEAPEKEKKAYKGYVKKLETAVERWRDPDGKLRAARSEEWTKLAAEAAELELDVSRRRVWTFASGEDRWWHVQLSKLVKDLLAFTDESTGGLFSAGVSEAHGWGVEKRAEFARTIEERSVSGAEARKLWDQAIASIRDETQCPKYKGLVMTPQVGILPIGPDPGSGLWEFAHLQSGDPAVRGADGKLILKEEMGLVLVLIPGGTFKMGAQSTDPTEANYDPQASSDESPVRAVTLAPYFLSKYEMTQGQWLRFVGSNPSQYGPHNYGANWNAQHRPADLLHPVEQVSWIDCTETLDRLGLALPTEAQWERAARAETDTPWWTGDDLASLGGAANLSDSYGKSHGNEAFSPWEKDLDDGSTAHMAVGSYRANAYGLHDVAGNLWEWCRDGSGGYDLPVRADDGEREEIGLRNRGQRGGGFLNPAVDARSAYRFDATPELRATILGCRPTGASSPSPFTPSPR